MAEERYFDRGKAMFQLRRRLDKKYLSNTGSQPHPITSNEPNSPQEPIDEDPLIESDREFDHDEPNCDNDDEDIVEIAVDTIDEVLTPCSDKSAEGHRKTFARFGRRRTHNEQLCVTSCGIVLGRATFYGAEGPNSVRVSCFLTVSLRQQNSYGI
jgi:hypothetical protein